MSYVTSKERRKFDKAVDLLEEYLLYEKEYGNKHNVFREEELNYVVTKLCRLFLEFNGKKCETYNALLGILEDVKLEVYRDKKVEEYEDRKEAEKGKV